MPEQNQAVEFSGSERYRIKRRIGEGAMGVVYEAFDAERQTRIALKTLRYADARALTRLKNEFRALAHIVHPNLVQLGELVCCDGVWFFTMDFVDGADFISYVRSTGPAGTEGQIDEGRLRAALGQLARVICHLHRVGMIHRDIKPSNIRVTPEGRVVLLDFGLVTDTQRVDALESTENAIGTAAYMAPECLTAEPTGEPADWYAFGVIIYEALAGRRPFESSNPLTVLMKKGSHAPPPLVKVRPDAPVDLARLAHDLLQIDPDLRPSGQEILRRLQVVPEPETPAPMGRHRTRSILTPFVGRKPELAALWAGFDESRVGHSVILLVHGASGVGKSALVQQFSSALREEHPDVVLLDGRCFERESVPYKAFDGIVDKLRLFMSRRPEQETQALLPLRASMLPQLFPVLQRVEAIAGAPRDIHESSDPQERRSQMFAAFRELFCRLAQRHNVVLVVDDLQWVDPDSLTLLDELLHPPEEPALLLIGTTRPLAGDKQQLFERIDALPVDVRHIELDVLPPHGARELVGLLAPESSLQSEQIADEAGGHPLFIRELVLYLLEEGTTTTAARLDDALWARIARLDGPGRRVIDLLAISGRPLPQSVLADAADIPNTAFERVVGRLRLGSLIRTSGVQVSDTIETYHDRVREAVLVRLQDDMRRELHSRLATALERAGAAADEPQVLVRHFEAAGRADRAAQHAEEAAQRALRVSAFDHSAELFQAALRLYRRPRAQTRAMQLQLGQALVNAGRGPEAAEIYRQAAEGADHQTRLECRRREAEQWLNSGYIERGLDSLSSLLAEIGLKLRRTPHRALLSLIWHRFRLRLRGFRWKGRTESQITPEQLIELDVYKAVSRGLAMVDTVHGADYSARYVLKSLKLGEPVRVGTALGVEAIHYASQGGRAMRLGKRLSGKLDRVAREDGSGLLQIWSGTIRGLVAYFEGRFRDADGLLGQMEQAYIASGLGAHWELNQTRLFRIFCLRYLGAWGQLAQLSERYIRDAARRGDRFLETTLRRYCTFLRLAADLPAQARQQLSAASWTPPKGKFHLQHWFDLESRVELALYERRGAEALVELKPAFDGLGGSLLTRIQVIRAVAPKLKASLLLDSSVGGVPSAAIQSEVERLAKQISRVPAGYATLFSAMLLAALNAQRGAISTAIEQLQQAEATAERHEMRLFAAAAAYRRGVLCGGEAGAKLCSAAEAKMRAEGVVSAPRLCNVLTPGFP